jgi:hypothetical protein
MKEEDESILIYDSEDDDVDGVRSVVSNSVSIFVSNVGVNVCPCICEE